MCAAKVAYLLAFSYGTPYVDTVVLYADIFLYSSVKTLLIFQNTLGKLNSHIAAYWYESGMVWEFSECSAHCSYLKQL